MLLELSNHDDTVHFKNDPLGSPNISSENHDKYNIISNNKKKKTREKRLKFKYMLALLTLSIKTQLISASKKNINNMNILYEKIVEKSTKILDEITHLFLKKTFAKLINSCIELDSIRKLLLKFFYTNYHILITHIFF